MLRKLEIEALQADLSNIDRLLDQRNESNDPIGFLQFNSRKSELKTQIEKMEKSSDTSAGVALFFGGKPVVGSRGINAEFAGKAIEAFQDMVSKKFSTIEAGALAPKGPIPLKANTELMLTDVARGSFGLILEEIGVNDSWTETALHTVVDDITQTIIDFAKPDIDKFEYALATIDGRLLVSLRDFFKLLDEEEATIRVVEGDTDAALESADVKRGRARTDSLKIEDTDADSIVGRLFILPQHRKFELTEVNSGKILYGAVTSEFTKNNLVNLQESGDVLGKVWRTKMRIRESIRPNELPKLSYTLLGLIEKIEDDPKT